MKSAPIQRNSYLVNSYLRFFKKHLKPTIINLICYSTHKSMIKKLSTAIVHVLEDHVASARSCPHSFQPQNSSWYCNDEKTIFWRNSLKIGKFTYCIMNSYVHFLIFQKNILTDIRYRWPDRCIVPPLLVYNHS